MQISFIQQENQQLEVEQSHFIVEKNKIVDISSVLACNFRYRKEQLIGRNYLDLFDQQDQRFLINQLNNVSSPFVVRGIKSDGTLISIEITKSIPICLNGKNYTLVQATEKNTQQLINLEKQQIKMLVHGLPIATIILNLDKKIEIWNEGAEQLFGWKALEVVGKTLPFLKDGDEFHSFFELTTKGKSISNREITRQRKDGSYVDLWISTTPYYNSEGVICGYVALYQDITDRKKSEQDIRDIKYALDQSAIVSVTDANGKISYVNDKFCEKYQYPREEMLGQDHRIINSRYHSSQFFQELWGSVAKGEIWRGEIRNKAKDGTISWMDATIIPFLNEKGVPYQYIAIRSDITERKKIEEEMIYKQEQIRLGEERLYSLVQHSNDLITIVDQNGIITYQSPSVEKLGYKIEDLLGKYVFDLIHQEDKPFVKNDFLSALTNVEGQTAFECRIKHCNGSWRHCSGTYTNFLNEPSINGIVINYRDITETKDALQTIEKMSYHDFLTGLPNKKFFEMKFNEALEEARVHNTQLALIHLDVDRFNSINETLGNEIGDQLLCEIANRLKFTTEKNGLLSRNVGDEFFIIVPQISDFQVISTLANSIIVSFDSPFLINTHEIYLTTSIGISIYPFTGDTVVGLSKNAAIALQEAKKRGKNNFQFYSSTMNLHSYKTFTLQNDLRRALSSQQFMLEYQPQVDVKTEKIIGAEALIRWNHPQWGKVPPHEFIAIAEETGLIVPIGEWVLETACFQNKKWQELGLPPITVSVNISPQQFMQENLFEKIKAILEKSKLDPKYLMIELTETSLVRDETAVFSTVTKLKNLGIKIAIDDFGTGYSSLNYLKKFKFNCLKIDKSFIKDLTEDLESKEITSTIIKLGKVLKMAIVAEGVETSEQLSCVQALDCDYVQGYYFYKPVPSKELEQLLSNGNKKTIAYTAPEVVQNNRRKFYRIEFKHRLRADMTIVNLGGKNVTLGTTKVLIENISGGGLRFFTNVRLPVRSDLILNFKLKLNNQSIDLLGSLVWTKEVDNELHQYGLEFSLPKNKQSQLISLLDTVQSSINNEMYQEVGDFVMNNEILM
ncbi:EAL domain-containing protein [Anaerobacillus sp. CMMVII]|uniref:EAL domain-containing protein n=1 Tax=Anaerobacillus sp. CMMVII TaxID=2755588 RepID=UPI0021B715B4|nr:EAL domain-containing protein [Anaerobacillus sp. CMMVII]MCT8137659.1 EAL domain-containing protein [Anaerobacillus sp. CMMVII]